MKVCQEGKETFVVWTNFMNAEIVIENDLIIPAALHKKKHVCNDAIKFWFLLRTITSECQFYLFGWRTIGAEITREKGNRK